MDIRVLRPDDIPHVQLANITNLPENYFCKYYLYHAMSWPQLSYVAVDVSCICSFTLFDSRGLSDLCKIGRSDIIVGCYSIYNSNYCCEE